MATTTPREEERAAREKQRQLERARKEAAKQRAKEKDSKLQGVIRDELSRPRAALCHCGFTTRTTMAEIQAMGAGCKAGQNGHGGYVCPTLDAIRRRMGR